MELRVLLPQAVMHARRHRQFAMAHAAEIVAEALRDKMLQRQVGRNLRGEEPLQLPAGKALMRYSVDTLSGLNGLKVYL